ncbi:MFS transporter [Sphingomonas aracearum]|uniref:MFS transporter n=1 Tax=Sphingomonas aracearum TaxID=2283317 RepID=A0A369VXL7_9SPHN|nr:MFS transporter [Sphingomonas aracearum]RDE07124.1 MFS transporter [Sphingomonas aracearum]
MNGTRLKAILGGSAGNLVEWYDFYAYAALTLYFAPEFFPKSDPTAQLLSAAAIYAVGFLMRPIGAYVMGVYGDRHGRKAGLALSVGLMFAGSLLIAVAPTYRQAGALAPALLLVARLLQGLSVGGEYGTSATYLSEMASAEHRGFWSSFQYVTLIGGQLGALGVVLVLQAVLDEAALQAWGWRVPFAIGAGLALVVYLLRRRLAETASFEAMSVEERRQSGALRLLNEHPRAFWLVAIISAGGGLGFYAYTTYMQKFLVNTAGFDRATATRVMTAALFLYMCAQPVFGAVSDRVGRRPMLLLFGIGGALASVPAFTALAEVRSPAAAFAIVVCLLLLLSGYTAISALVKAELFPASIRTLGVALPYALGNALFGGTAEFVALWFKRAGAEAAFFWYVAAALAVTSVAFWMLPETKRTSLIAD